MRRVFAGLVLAVVVAGCGTPKDAGRVVRIEAGEQGYSPQVVDAAVGEPVTLVFRRTTEATCATEVVFARDGSKHVLPLNKDVKVTLNPSEPGDIQYACGMNMFTGTIAVK